MNNCDTDIYKPKDTVIIYFIWWAKGHGLGKHFYCAEMNGEVIDYHTKGQLIKNAEEKKLPWQVLRYHKKQCKVSILQKSNYDCKHVYSYHWLRGRCKGSKCTLCGNINTSIKPEI